MNVIWDQMINVILLELMVMIWVYFGKLIKISYMIEKLEISKKPNIPKSLFAYIWQFHLNKFVNMWLNTDPRVWCWHGNGVTIALFIFHNPVLLGNGLNQLFLNRSGDLHILNVVILISFYLNYYYLLICLIPSLWLLDEMEIC